MEKPSLMATIACCSYVVRGVEVRLTDPETDDVHALCHEFLVFASSVSVGDPTKEPGSRESFIRVDLH
jgi:hypothetical protein